MPRNKKPTIALIYDFDGTLSPNNMQEYKFLKEIGIKNKNDFWKENSEMVKKHNASNILCYMELMIKKSKDAGKPIKKKTFQNYGKSVKLYDGVEDWFDLIEKIGKQEGVKIEHYINSSGLKEMIEGTSIAKKFKEIYACSFMYNENDVAEWPAVAVDFTAKTQFLFMINKGISKISDNSKVNEYKSEDERPIPFKHMIYFGDGETDIPCMKLVKQYGGKSIAVYNPSKRKRETVTKLIDNNRVNFVCKADYTKDSEIYNIVKTIIVKIKADCDFRQLELKNRNQHQKHQSIK